VDLLLSGLMHPALHLDLAKTEKVCADCRILGQPQGK